MALKVTVLTVFVKAESGPSGKFRDLFLRADPYHLY